MRSISMYHLTLVFDGDQITHGTPEEQVAQAIHEINLVLQREPYGLGAQIMLADSVEAIVQEDPNALHVEEDEEVEED